MIRLKSRPVLHYKKKNKKNNQDLAAIQILVKYEFGLSKQKRVRRQEQC